MDYNFDAPLPATTFGTRMAAPFRRWIHRLLTPTFDRLRALLQGQTARQDADRARIEVLERQVAALQAKVEACRPLLTDYLALTRRLGLVEDRLLGDLAVHRQPESSVAGRAA